MLLFFSSVATTRTTPTPLGFHAADVMLHGVLAVVNLALLMWLIPDELGDPIWVPRRRQGRGRDRRQPVSATNPGSSAAAGRAQVSSAHGSPPQHSVARGQPSHPGSTGPPVSVRPATREQSGSQETNEPLAHDVENSTQVKHLAARAKGAVLSRGGVVTVAVAVLAAVVGIVVWMRHR